MFDQLIDGVRKASESSLQMQQEMFKHWTRLFTGPAQEAGAQAGAQAEWGRTSQKRWLELGVEMLNRHREAVDSIYKSGRRSPEWCKLKLVRHQTCVVGGWTEPRQTRST